MSGPEKMITIPPRHYCIIENPVVKGEDEKPVVDANGQIKLLHADQVHLTNNRINSRIKVAPSGLTIVRASKLRRMLLKLVIIIIIIHCITILD